MSRKFSVIINILIFILIMVLVYVMMNYYTSGSSKIPEDTPASGPYYDNSEKIEKLNLPIIESIDENDDKSGDESLILDIIKSGEVIEESGEVAPMANTNVSPENTSKSKVNTPEQASPVIITSENEISSKEKREILSDLDKTLMELLDVVDKVQLVDESRLPSDSEVQP